MKSVRNYNPWLVTILGGAAAAIFAQLILFLLGSMDINHGDQSRNPTNPEVSFPLSIQLNSGETYKDSNSGISISYSNEFVDGEKYGSISIASGQEMSTHAVYGPKQPPQHITALGNDYRIWITSVDFKLGRVEVTITQFNNEE